MSERSSFVSDNLVYFAPNQLGVAQELVEHISKVMVGAYILQNQNHVAVAGFILSSGANVEWECLTNLPPFAHDVSLVINSESGGVCRYNLKTHQFEIYNQ